MNKLEQVRAKIVEAVPEIESWNQAPGSLGALRYWRPITLADVLRALWKADIAMEKFEFTNKESLLFIPDYWPEEWVEDPYCEWNLAENLDNQPEEVIDFLAKILLPNNK